MNSYLKSPFSCKVCLETLYFKEGHKKLLCRKCNSYFAFSHLQSSAFPRINQVSQTRAQTLADNRKSIFTMLALLKDQRKVSIRIQ